MTKTCSVCGTTLDENPLSGPAHARKHRNRFEEIVGRQPESYDEVREFFDGCGAGVQVTLADAVGGEST